MPRSPRSERNAGPPRLTRLKVSEPTAADVDLSRRAVRGGSVTVSVQVLRFVLQTISTVVLARLLVPEDFGLIAMVVVFTTLASLLKDLGLSTATLQSPSITQGQASNLLWINVGLGFLITAGFVLSAPLVAGFYGEPELIGIMLALAPVFVLNGLTAQHLALMRRAMSYGRVAAVEMAGQAVSVLAALVLAWRGFGYWSLVALHGVAAPVNLVLAWRLSGWLPSAPVRGADMRSLLSFGGHLTGFTFLNYFTRQADKVLIGWLLGASTLGVYSKAYELFQMPMRQLNPPVAAVALPTLSRLRSTPEAYRTTYLRVTKLLCFLSIPAVALAAGVADLAIPFVLGRQWTDAVPVFRYLALGGILGPMLWTAGWVHQSLGRADRQLRWSLVSDPLYVLSFLVGANWGIEGVALAFSVAVLVLFLPTMWYALAPSPVSLVDVVRTLARPAVLGFVAFASAFASAGVGSADAVGLLLRVFLAVFASALLIGVWPALRRDLKQQLRVARHLKSGRSAGAASK